MSKRAAPFSMRVSFMKQAVSPYTHVLISWFSIYLCEVYPVFSISGVSTSKNCGSGKLSFIIGFLRKVVIIFLIKVLDIMIPVSFDKSHYIMWNLRRDCFSYFICMCQIICSFVKWSWNFLCDVFG